MMRQFWDVVSRTSGTLYVRGPSNQKVLETLM
jgi:hypothetical protein